MIISHVNTKNMSVQSNEDHCRGVAALAERFAAEFGCGQLGRILGLLHDKGKEKTDFQTYIAQATGLSDKNLHYDDKTHAYVGALIAAKQYGALQLLTYPIAGHHTGLHDYPDMTDILRKELPQEVIIPESEGLLKPGIPTPQSSDWHHLVRMLFSCLVDADFLDTEKFMSPESNALRGTKESLKSLLPRLEKFLNDIALSAARTPVNQIRAEIQAACREAASSAPGFYSLTVPTGGGKTLSSMLWAMLHAIRHDKKRIIIAIPYTSIVTQTASVLSRIFGEENVLEHHSNTSADDEGDTTLKPAKKLATENWDYPIVVTTNVQLFESMLSARPSKCRKLHNISNSVIILDEIQTLPVDRLQPIVDSLKTYERLFGASVLFTTASMPTLTGDIVGNGRAAFCGIENIHEIVPPSAALHNRLRRTRINFDTDISSYSDIAGRLASHKRVLCIVNTRKDASELYKRLPESGRRLHLSRMMCAAHLRRKIEELKRLLKDPSVTEIRVVATQLIEAGVDIDFPVVYRQESGLDSILQAAGRCNREGRSEMGQTYVFSLAGEHALPPGQISLAAGACRNIDLTDPFDPETMRDYFRHFYSRARTFDKGPDDAEHFIADTLCKPFDFMFEEASAGFRLIEDAGQTVYVNWDDSPRLINQLKVCGPTYGLMRKLGMYAVQLTKRDFDKMRGEGLIEEVLEGIFWIPSERQYTDASGVTIENHWLEEILIQ